MILLRNTTFKDVRSIVKAFLEFGRETSYTRSSSHAEFKTLLKMIPDEACFHLFGLFCYKALTVKVQKTCKNAV